MPEGTVARFFANKGFGFIKCEEFGKDVFAHAKEIKSDQTYRYLAIGEQVEFEVEQTARGLEARAIRSPQHRRRGKVLKFDPAQGTGRIQPDGLESKPYFFHVSQVLRSNPHLAPFILEDDWVEFEVGTGPKGPKDVQAVAVKPLDDRLPLFRFADMGDEQTWVDALEDLAADEDWGGPKFPVLKKYLIYTYGRLADEMQAGDTAKVQFKKYEGRRYACFNTGLMTPRYKPIYAVFAAKKWPDHQGRKWGFSCFTSEKDRNFLKKFSIHPEPANYFDDPSQVFYNRRAHLSLDYDHIAQRVDRLPPKVRAAVEDDPDDLQHYLDKAKTRAVTRVQQNFKTAIPAYYQNRIQLLLPLCMVNDQRADVALAVTRFGDSYLGRTILRIEWAYSMARLLVKPDTEWLKPVEPDENEQEEAGP